jgi:hypothetical protein
LELRVTERGLDYAWSRPSVAAIKAGGYVFVSRYLSWVNPSTAGKVIIQAEAKTLLAAGIDIYLNWEFDAQDCIRGTDGGTTDATEAVRQARALGYPRGATLFHSADFDVTDDQKPVVAAYFVAARAVEHAAGYRTGCYSGFWTVKYLLDHDAIDDAWQAFAWSGGRWESRAALRQVQNDISVDGADCDLDERVGIAYSWLHPAGATAVQAQEGTMRFKFVGLPNTPTGLDGRVHVTDGLRYRVYGLSAQVDELLSAAGAAPIVSVTAADLPAGWDYPHAVSQLCGHHDPEPVGGGPGLAAAQVSVALNQDQP